MFFSEKIYSLIPFTGFPKN